MATADNVRNRPQGAPLPEDRPSWSNPELRELGNIKDFVQTGNAFGKSVLINDGQAMAGGESMP